jgi:membrane fusion protein, adhesin transport system
MLGPDEPHVELYDRSQYLRTLRISVYAVSGLIFLALLWSAIGRLDVVTRAEGRVIALGKAQLVQSLEGGIVRELLVKEGDLVNEGQPLARIDDTKFSADFGEVQAKREVLQARILRLRAELSGQSSLSAEAEGISPALLATERDLLVSRRDEYGRATEVLRAQLAQRVSEVEELGERAARLANQLNLAQQERALVEPLVLKGAVPKVEELRLSREVAGLQGDLSATRVGLSRAREAVGEVRQRLEEHRATYANELRKDLTQATADLAVLDETVRGAADRVQRAVIRSPIRGIVNKLDLTLPGAVLQPGRTLMEITPAKGALEVELRVRPQDIAFLHPGQKANLKLSAYDFSQYGSLPGTLARVGADTITDEKGETFYRAIVESQTSSIEHNGKPLKVMPGMMVTADIIVGERSVLDYIIKPLAKAQGEVFRER